MKRILLVAVLLIGGCAVAQTAKVVQLKPEDAAKAAAISHRIEQAQAELIAFNEHVRETYLAVKEGEAGDCSSGATYFTLGGKTITSPAIHYRVGWHCGSFEYSDDYKFIVPKSEPPAMKPYPLFVQPAEPSVVHPVASISQASAPDRSPIVGLMNLLFLQGEQLGTLKPEHSLMLDLFQQRSSLTPTEWQKVKAALEGDDREVKRLEGLINKEVNARRTP